MPQLTRPYKVPLGTVGCVLMLVPAVVLLLIVMGLASWFTIGMAAVVVVVGMFLPSAMDHCKQRRWLQFYESEPEGELVTQDEAEAVIPGLHAAPSETEEVGLLGDNLGSPREGE